MKKNLQKNIELFLEELNCSADYSSHTLSAYKRDLKLYKDFSKKNQKLELFYEYIDRQGLGARSKARVISSLRSFLRWLEEKGQKTQLKKLVSVPVKIKKLPKLISPEEFKKILKASQEDHSCKTARNKITLLLLFGLGCRISEAVQLNLQNINETDSSITLTGKRNKQRLLPLTKSLYTQLTDYIRRQRPKLLDPGKQPEEHSILINNKGRRPSRVDVWRWLELWSKKAGFQQVKSPHQFRHGFATSLLENGADLRSIQFLLGHSSIQTTQIYTSVKQDRLKKTIAGHHPLSGLKSKTG